MPELYGLSKSHSELGGYQYTSYLNKLIKDVEEYSIVY